VAELAAEAAGTGNRNLRGDAVAGALLAEAACCASSRLADLNLAGRPHDQRRMEASDLTQRALQARLMALSTTRDV
jgi:hypothetical protein